ncbi:Uncharacterised protein [Mycobacteroides abscessus]|nr:Uncharacterised protein [Mycobacteroides abscessus]
MTSRRNSASTNPTRTSGTRYQNAGASASVNASTTPVWIGSGSCCTSSGVSEEPSAPAGAAPPGTPAKTPSRLSASRDVKMVLNSAVPTAAPISRKKLFALVAVPISCGSTEFCTASTIVCMTRPIPAPMTKIIAPKSHIDMSPVMRVSQTIPAAVIASPTTG